MSIQIANEMSKRLESKEFKEIFAPSKVFDKVSGIKKKASDDSFESLLEDALSVGITDEQDISSVLESGDGYDEDEESFDVSEIINLASSLSERLDRLGMRKASRKSLDVLEAIASDLEDAAIIDEMSEYDISEQIQDKDLEEVAFFLNVGEIDEDLPTFVIDYPVSLSDVREIFEDKSEAGSMYGASDYDEISYYERSPGVYDIFGVYSDGTEDHLYVVKNMLRGEVPELERAGADSLDADDVFLGEFEDEEPEEIITVFSGNPDYGMPSINIPGSISKEKISSYLEDISSSAPEIFGEYDGFEIKPDGDSSYIVYGIVGDSLFRELFIVEEILGSYSDLEDIGFADDAFIDESGRFVLPEVDIYGGTEDVINIPEMVIEAPQTKKTNDPNSGKAVSRAPAVRKSKMDWDINSGKAVNRNPQGPVQNLPEMVVDNSRKNSGAEHIDLREVEEYAKSLPEILNKYPLAIQQEKGNKGKDTDLREVEEYARSLSETLSKQPLGVAREDNSFKQSK